MDVVREDVKLVGARLQSKEEDAGEWFTVMTPDEEQPKEGLDSYFILIHEIIN